MSIFDKREIKFLIGTLGIYGSYMAYGILQESLFSKKYQSSNSQETARFTFPWSVLFLQCLVATIVSKIASFNEESKKQIGLKDQIFQGFYNAFSMLGSNTALQYMSYPLQALFKSCKVLSVLIVGLIFGKVNYPTKQYVCGLIVTVGIIGFNLQEKQKEGKETQVIGIVLIVASLFFDGMLAEKQNMIRKECNPSSFKLMEACSSWCVIFSLIYAICLNQLVPFIEFCKNYPSALMDISLLGILGCIGQIFIFYIIKHFGPVVLALITTTRKFFTVLSSIIVFGHSISLGQWISVGLVLLGLSMELYDSQQKKKLKKEEPLLKSEIEAKKEKRRNLINNSIHEKDKKRIEKRSHVETQGNKTSRKMSKIQRSK